MSEEGRYSVKVLSGCGVFSVDPRFQAAPYRHQGGVNSQ